MIRHILFDLDDTLYPQDVGLMEALDRRIAWYMVEELAVERDAVKRLQSIYCQRYGSCTRGLVLHHDLQLEHYLAYIHDIDVEKYLEPDGSLAYLLPRIAAEKHIFTNGPVEYARRILDALKIRRHFRRIFDIRFLRFVGKPDTRAYRRVLRALGAIGEECLLVEDSARNLAPAKGLGMVTILVGSDGVGCPEYVDVAVRDLACMGEAMRAMGLLIVETNK